MIVVTVAIRSVPDEVHRHYIAALCPFRT